MEAKQLITLINNTENISDNEVAILDSILLKYPYFQNGQLLLTKGLLNNNSIRYNSQLKKTAAYCLDRRKLFKLITLKNKKKTELDKDKKESKISTEEKLEIGAPLRFDKTENHSFSEWLRLANIKKINRGNEDVITKFLAKEQKIIKPKKELFFNATDFAKESLIEDHELVTPTLAKVYLEQEHYNKAISAYEKLILKYPKKSSFFASQITLIRKLNNK